MPITGERNSIWADALDPIVRFRFDLAFNRRASLIPALFNVQGSVRAYEQVSGAGAVGIDGWTAYEQSGQVAEADFDQGYKTTYTHLEYPLKIVIKRKLIDDANFAQVFRIVERVGDSASLKRETDAASIFNNAFTDTAPYAGADAVGLCSTVHPNSPQKTGSTQANEGTYSLTRDNVATVREAMMAFTDDNGNKMGVTPNRILVPPALEDEALVIAKTLSKPGSGDNDINPQAGRFEVVPWHYLTDSNAWFMIDSSLAQMSLDWFNRTPLSVTPMVEDKTIQASWIAYMRYSTGWSDWRWIYGNNPS
jgi:Mu-like prophage major head subunit gpT